MQLPFLQPEIDWFRHSQTAEGVVLRLRAGNHKPDVAFTTVTGDRLSVAGSSTWCKFRVGDQVTVRYDTRSPTLARIDGIFNLWGWHVFLTALALFAFTKGISGVSQKKRIE